MPRKPNFIVILADDLGYGDIGCDGGTLIRTPQLDRMAAEGARLGYTSIVDASAVHVREAVRLAFASAADEPAGIPEF